MPQPRKAPAKPAGDPVNRTPVAWWCPQDHSNFHSLPVCGGCGARLADDDTIVCQRKAVA